MNRLFAFRHRNKLTQKDVGSFLGVSVAFISLVEKGRARLSDEKMHSLICESQWDCRDLHPSFERFCLAWRLHNSQNGSTTEESFAPLEDKNPFGISISVIEDLFYGKMEIDEHLADMISIKMPEINKDWLINGEGNPVKTQAALSYEERITILETEISTLRKEIEAIKKKYN